MEAHLPHLNQALSSVLALQKPGVVSQAYPAALVLYTQEDQKLKVILGYIVNLKHAWVI